MAVWLVSGRSEDAMNKCQCTKVGDPCKRYAGHAFDNGQYAVWLCESCWDERCHCVTEKEAHDVQRTKDARV